MKGFKDQVMNAGKKGKDKLDDIKSKEWAEPTGKALKAAASVVSVIPPPVGNVLKGALSMGGAVLNPDPTLADLRRAKDEINNAMQAAFQEVAEDMGDMKTELSDLRGDIGPVLQLISDKEFYDGIATIDAHHEFYTENPEDLEGTNDDFEAVATSFQISFKKNFRVSKIFHFLKMIQKQEGNEACNKYFQDNLVSYGKYLQIIFAYLTYKGDLKKIKILTEKFLKDYEELSSIPWRVVVVDEAHRLRTDGNKLTGCLKEILVKGEAEYEGFQLRLLMTGTPLQNNTVSFAINQARKQDSERASTSTHQQACQNLPVAVSFF